MHVLPRRGMRPSPLQPLPAHLRLPAPGALPPPRRRSECLCGTSPWQWPQQAAPTRERRAGAAASAAAAWLCVPPGRHAAARPMPRLCRLAAAPRHSPPQPPGDPAVTPLPRPALPLPLPSVPSVPQAGRVRDARPGCAGQRDRGRDRQCGAGCAARADQPGAEQGHGVVCYARPRGLRRQALGEVQELQERVFLQGSEWPVHAFMLPSCLDSPLPRQGRPDKPDIRVCRLPDIKRKMNNRRASVKDGGERGCGLACSLHTLQQTLLACARGAWLPRTLASPAARPLRPPPPPRLPNPTPSPPPPCPVQPQPATTST